METLIRVLPPVNASLNALAATLLVYGLVLIKHKRVQAHKRVMISAFCVSILFLISYLTYHTCMKIVAGQGHTTWKVDGWIRPTYYIILFSHITLAAIVPFLAVRTLYLGLKRRDAQHRRIARITWPVWMYVSVTGVVVYFMIYIIQPMLLPR